MPRTQRLVGLVLLLLAGGADWPRFHGPQGTGVEQLHQNPPLDESDFNASPAIVGQQILLRSNKHLYCIE